MKAVKVKLDRSIAMIVGTASLALALLVTSCGGGSSANPAANGAVAAPSLSPNSLTFTSQSVGSATTAQVITLTNSGKADLSLTSIAVSGANSADFAQSNNCGSSVAAGASCAISVTFKPGASGTRTAAVALSDNATGSPHNVALSGAIATTVASVSPTSLALGSQPLSTASPIRAITLTNTGKGNLNVTSVAVSGVNASDFTQSNNCGSSVAAGTNCTINVTFKPAAAGTRTAAVVVADTAVGSPQTVALSGTGDAPVASVSPSSLAFGNQAVGVTSSAQSVTLTNSGNAVLNVSRIAVSGTNASDFAQTNNCGTSVAAGANCTISVTFKPSAGGSRSAALAVTDNAAGSPQSVSLSGTGVSTGVTVSPSSVAFGNQAVGAASSARPVTLTNAGSSALSITSIAVLGVNASDFAQSNNCGSSVAAGANCTINVTFKPSVAGSRSTALAITDNATGSPQSVSLSGTGVSTGVTLSPSSVAFGNQSLGAASSAHTVTLTNSGNSTLTVSSIAVFGTNASDFTENNTCGTSVAAGGTCTIVVLFTPSALGARAAVLSVSDNATGSPQSVTLSGAATSGHNVALTWTASPTAGILGYNIYRGTISGGESTTPINANPVSGAAFTDDVVTAGAEYFYVVTSVTSDGVTQSAASPEASAAVPSP
jgi:phosphatidylethanolamine-binding protein (PEBP) family uncharacterized protein